MKAGITAAISQAYETIVRLNCNDRSNWLQTYAKNRLNTFSHDLEFYLKFDLGSTVLEYGSPPFIFPLALNQLGYNCICSDIDPTRFFNVEKLGLNIIKCDYDKDRLDIHSNSIDSIICNEVFEHLRINLIFSMNEAYRVLKPGGSIFIGTPNLLSARGIYNLIRHDICYSCAGDLYHEWNKLDHLGHMGHVREYTPTEIKAFLQKIGFKSFRVYYTKPSISFIEKPFEYIMYSLIPRLRPKFKIQAFK